MRSAWRYSDQDLDGRRLAVDLRRTKNPFREGLRNWITDASVGSFLYCNLADLAFLVHDGADHDLPLRVSLLR